MTISYRDNFVRALFRWRGSAWKAVWKELLLWLTLYYAIMVILNYALISDEAKERGKLIVDIFYGFTKDLPLQFLLGFYVGQVVTRWWQQVLKLPWPDDLIPYINAVLPQQTREMRLRRHTIGRYLILCQLLALRNMSNRIRKRFPNVETLVDAGFMTKEELKLYNNCPVLTMRWQLPLQWVMNSVLMPITGTEPDQLTIGQITTFLGQMTAFKQSLRELFMFDWVCIPLVYTQTVSVVLYGYFSLCLIGHQYYGKETNLFIPFLTIVQLVFYVGWFKVAEDLMRPFGEDDDDVELNYIMDRNSAVTFALANYVDANNPPLVEDPLFKQINSELGEGQEPLQISAIDMPYSKMAMRNLRDRPPKVHANAPIRTKDDAEMIFVTSSWWHRHDHGLQNAPSMENGDRVNTNSGNGIAHVLRRSKSAGDGLKATHKRESVGF